MRIGRPVRRPGPASRAATFEPDGELDEIAQICRRVDGLPLAIELAAARVGVLSTGDIRRGLDRRFQLLAGGARTVVARHRSMRACIDWSIRLLDDDERTVLDRLSIFPSSWTLASARAVVPDGDARRRRGGGRRARARPPLAGDDRRRDAVALPVARFDPRPRGRGAAALRRPRGGHGEVARRRPPSLRGGAPRAGGRQPRRGGRRARRRPRPAGGGLRSRRLHGRRRGVGAVHRARLLLDVDRTVRGGGAVVRRV